MRRLPCLVILLAASTVAWPATAAPQRLAEGVVLLPGSFTPGRQPDGSSLLFIGPDGAVAVDSGRHIEHTQSLLDEAAARGARLRAVINTHWHLDHLGGNALLRERVPGLQVIASDAVAGALGGWLANSRRDLQALLDSGRADAATQAMVRIDIALIDAGPRLLPDTTVTAARELRPAGQVLQIGVARQAVTAADLWVYEPRSRVLAAGDLVTLPVPFLDTACPAGWRSALNELQAQPFETLVPGHGPAMQRTEFTRWQQAFNGLLDCAAADGPASACVEGWISALGSLLPASELPRARGMLGSYIAEHLRAPGRDRYCKVTAPSNSATP
jgi:glyoxylase-like metal-dependent hydrolase (beta-lactamase superfamily II)